MNGCDRHCKTLGNFRGREIPDHVQFPGLKSAIPSLAGILPPDLFHCSSPPFPFDLKIKDFPVVGFGGASGTDSRLTAELAVSFRISLIRAFLLQLHR